MNARFAILLVVVAVLGVGLYIQRSAPRKTPDAVNRNSMDQDDGLTAEERERIRELQKLLAERDLPGTEPPDPPEFSVQVEVDRGSGKNRLCFYVSEAHAYYVETLNLNFWYNARDRITGEKTQALMLTHYANRYLEADDTLKLCVEVNPAELNRIGGDIGISEDWEAEVVSYGRARLENPDPLPPL